MASDNNDFLKVQFSIMDEYGKLIETTDEAEAKAGNIYNEKAKYGYSLVLMGDRKMVKGFREALESGKVGEQKTVAIKKEDAFGDRREDLVVLLPQKKFEEANINPQVGMVVDLDGSQGRVQSISGGRVRVDMNHELAGKNIQYKFKILEKLTTPEGKLNALMEEQFNAKDAAKMNGESAVISVTQEMMKEEKYLQWKYYIIQAALQFIAELKKIEWKEEFLKPQ